MTGLRVRLGYCVASSSAPMCSSPGLTSEAMESVAISTSARGAVLSWKDWGGGREQGIYSSFLFAQEDITTILQLMPVSDYLQLEGGVLGDTIMWMT